ncbi:hypothetical protein DO66_3773 [Burkholderia pseudomallei]|nr:hypothetical protein DO66_3773 [Burkholderia pseudomallei]
MKDFEEFGITPIIGLPTWKTLNELGTKNLYPSLIRYVLRLLRRCLHCILPPNSRSD